MLQQRIALRGLIRRQSGLVRRRSDAVAGELSLGSGVAFQLSIDDRCTVLSKDWQLLFASCAECILSFV
jgi:hypothetical protein